MHKIGAYGSAQVFRTVLRVLLDEESSKLLMEFWMVA